MREKKEPPPFDFSYYRDGLTTTRTYNRDNIHITVKLQRRGINCIFPDRAIPLDLPRRLESLYT